MFHQLVAASRAAQTCVHRHQKKHQRQDCGPSKRDKRLSPGSGKPRDQHGARGCQKGQARLRRHRARPSRRCPAYRRAGAEHLLPSHDDRARNALPQPPCGRGLPARQQRFEPRAHRLRVRRAYQPMLAILGRNSGGPHLVSARPARAIAMASKHLVLHPARNQQRGEQPRRPRQGKGAHRVPRPTPARRAIRAAPSAAWSDCARRPMEQPRLCVTLAQFRHQPFDNPQRGLFVGAVIHLPGEHEMRPRAGWQSNACPEPCRPRSKNSASVPLPITWTFDPRWMVQSAAENSAASAARSSSVASARWPKVGSFLARQQTVPRAN